MGRGGRMPYGGNMGHVGSMGHSFVMRHGINVGFGGKRYVKVVWDSFGLRDDSLTNGGLSFTTCHATFNE